MCFSVFWISSQRVFHAFDHEDVFIFGWIGVDAIERCRMAVFAGHTEVYSQQEQLFVSKDC